MINPESVCAYARKLSNGTFVHLDPKKTPMFSTCQAMTSKDWCALLDQGFRIEIAPPAPKVHPAPKHKNYGQARKLAREFLDTAHGMSRAEFAQLKGIPLESLSYAIRGLRGVRNREGREPKVRFA